MSQLYDDIATPDLDEEADAQDNLFGDDYFGDDEGDSDDDFAQPYAAPKRQRGAVTRADGRVVVGRVGAPPQQEATSSTFHFWVAPDALVEKSQIVTCDSVVGAQSYTFYALVDEVHRQSYKRNMRAEIDEADGDLTYEPPLNVEGFTYATASILRVEPLVLTPPRERSEVLLAGPDEARMAYEADQIENPLTVGLMKNGGGRVAGPGAIDLDYMLGANGGHMNVNGAAGRGTKSSFLLYIIWQLLREAARQRAARPSAPDRLRLVPIILNVKNFDLFYIDRWSTRYDPEEHLGAWQETGVDAPAPFTDVTYYAAQQPNTDTAIATGRVGIVNPYSWSLSDIVGRGLLPYLFASDDVNDDNFGALVLDIENTLTRENVANDGSVSRSLRPDETLPKTFDTLLTWVGERANNTKADKNGVSGSHAAQTWKKLHRRLMKLLYESKGVLRRAEAKGNPLDLVRADTSAPLVVDLAALASEPGLQRFVVATIFRQLVEARTGANAVSGLIYTVMLDELNRFAPKGAKDPITQLIETVAAEMRSQGIILLGAQQQASKVSEKVIENAGIRVLGKTGSMELGAANWRFLSDSARRKAESLRLDEKLVMQDNFREPMHIRVPFPAWAMNPREARTDLQDNPATTALYDDIIDD